MLVAHRRRLLVKYEAHYWDADITGKSEQDWESIHLKGIYFPKEGKWGDTPYRTAVGLEWIKSFDNAELGRGSDRGYNWGAGLGIRFIY